MARRIAALIGFVSVLLLAGLLLYRVYQHHTDAPHPPDDETAIVRYERALPRLGEIAGPIT